MNTEEYPDLPKSLEKYVGLPYGGLFGDAVIVRIVQEIVADPNRQFTPKYLERLTGRSLPQIKASLDTLVNLKLLKKIQADPQRPIYETNLASNQLMALTFLAYSSIDDREGTTCMKEAVFEYCEYCKFDSKIKISYGTPTTLRNYPITSTEKQTKDYNIRDFLFSTPSERPVIFRPMAFGSV
jgi:hypothetical protein